jgi:hypothetical protein
MVVAITSLLVMVLLLVVDGALVVVVGIAFLAQLTISATASKVGSIFFMLVACKKLCQNYFSHLFYRINGIKKAS